MSAWLADNEWRTRLRLKRVDLHSGGSCVRKNEDTFICAKRGKFGKARAVDAALFLASRIRSDNVWLKDGR